MKKVGRARKRKEENRGGKREGAGRKPLFGECLAVKITFSLTNKQYMALEKFVENCGSNREPSWFVRAMVLEALKDEGLL